MDDSINNQVSNGRVLRQVLSFALIVMVIVFLIISFKNGFSNKGVPNAVSQYGKFTFIVDKHNGGVQTFTSSLTGNKENALEAMQKIEKKNTDFNFTDKMYSFGADILSIDGFAPNPNKQYWEFWVNGKSSNVGVSDYYIKKGDVLKFSLANS